MRDYVLSKKLKEYIEQSRLYRLVHICKTWIDLGLWRARGRTGPPPATVKRLILRRYGERYGLHTFVETGTFRGNTVAIMWRHFAKVYSIELNQYLFRRAQQRFARYPNVVIRHGDSASELPEILRELRGPALFWLDAHYSGSTTARGPEDTPVLKELDAILTHSLGGHVVLIDDAREFGRNPSYPTQGQLAAFIKSLRADLEINLADDIVRVTPMRRTCQPEASVS